MSNNETSRVGGLIFFHEGGRASGFVRLDGVRYNVRGEYDGDTVSVFDPLGRVGLAYRKVDQPSPSHPVGRGSLIIDGEQLPISVFRPEKRAENGATMHGIAEGYFDDLGDSADAPF